MASQPVYESYEEFVESVTPQWRFDLRFFHDRSLTAFDRGFQVLDFSSTGDLRKSLLELTHEEKDDIQKYRARLEAERQALKAEGKDIKIRLVMFSGVAGTLLRDLYGIEFRIEPSFLGDCERFAPWSRFDSSPLFVEDMTPTSLT
jgi:hypothetical protein